MSKKIKGKYKEIKCPACGSTLGELDFVPGIALIQGICEDGSIDFGGQTDIDWEGQKCAGRIPLYICTGCGKVYDSIHPHYHEAAVQNQDFTAVTEYDATWVCPECGRTVKHDYEGLADVGCPICTDCDCEMDRLGPPGDTSYFYKKGSKPKKISEAELKAKHEKQLVDTIAGTLAGEE